MRLLALKDVGENGGALGASITQAYARGGGASVLGVEIPLKGFGWLDWQTTPRKFKAMAFRGWEAMIRALPPSQFAGVSRTNSYA